MVRRKRSTVGAPQPSAVDAVAGHLHSRLGVLWSVDEAIPLPVRSVLFLVPADQTEHARPDVGGSVAGQGERHVRSKTCTLHGQRTASASSAAAPSFPLASLRRRKTAHTCRLIGTAARRLRHQPSQGQKRGHDECTNSRNAPTSSHSWSPISDPFASPPKVPSRSTVRPAATLIRRGMTTTVMSFDLASSGTCVARRM